MTCGPSAVTRTPRTTDVYRALERHPWSQVASPNPGGSTHDNGLVGVDAASASDAWAVGATTTALRDQTLILHWDGSSWLQFASPSPGAYSNTHGVTVVPGSGGSDAWAVGRYYKNISATTIVSARAMERHLPGAWCPAPACTGVDNEPFSISALSANDVWAVGVTVGTNPRPSQNLALHWDGTSWTIISIVQQGPYSNELLVSQVLPPMMYML